MPFLVAIAHFCEIHGPVTIMASIVVSVDKASSCYAPPVSYSQLCDSCALKIPSNLTTLETVSENSHFISTQYPVLQDMYTSLRQTIMRLFTVETNADASKPLLFGDTRNGYTLASTFKLSDKTARGSERRYAILVSTDKEMDLIKNFTFISTNLQSIVSVITTRGRHIYDQSTVNESNNNDFYLRRSAGLPKAKNMIEILEDENFFLKLHEWSCFVLKHVEI
ncbi:Lst7 protein [Martiniozyma asiatica (nom. inval.)]|nr:Lst7 protein [Martiniozyma asiatica]